MEFNNSDISDIDSPEPLLNSNEGNNNEVNESQQQAQRHYQQKKRKPKSKGWKDKENKNRNILEYVVETVESVETDVTKQANTKNNQNKNVYEHENDDEEYEDNNQGKDFGVSVVWDFFKKIDKNSAQCKAKECLKILSTPTSTTSTLKRHLKMHPEENKKMLELEEEKKKLKLKRQASNKNNVLIQSSLPNIFQKNTSYLKTSSKKMKLDEAVGKMIALDFQPYSIVEDRGFRELTYELDPRYTLPSRSKVARNIVPNLYEKAKTSIKEMIDKDKLNVESLCFMTDLWTSRAGHHYIAFNCQYINSDFFLISKTLGCYNFPAPHTAKAISDKLEDMLSEWKIDIEIPLYTVTDNAANMIAALSSLDNFNHLLCADHTLQLCIRHARIGLELDRILEKLQRIATRYHRSSKARMRLEYYQRLYKLPLLSLSLMR
ncbi:zinc finger BED domain-containing protein 4-like [Temnothorax nylanderi]|uniref:zinc finger BED domain-containing protein 4-like n=1 Tax=Temnothorax nylanderi TaxID=102681 RepID=UPI003A87F608